MHPEIKWFILQKGENKNKSILIVTKTKQNMAFRRKWTNMFKVLKKIMRHNMIHMENIFKKLSRNTNFYINKYRENYLLVANLKNMLKEFHQAEET